MHRPLPLRRLRRRPPHRRQACGEASTAAAAPGTASGILHDHQTETYIIVSGTGTLVTGGHIVNGRKSAPDSAVTQVLNGPSCSGRIEGADVVKKVVKTGDIIIIPAGTPHGWGDIPDHVDYLSVRPDPDRVLRRDTSIPPSRSRTLARRIADVPRYGAQARSRVHCSRARRQRTVGSLRSSPRPNESSHQPPRRAR